MVFFTISSDKITIIVWFIHTFKEQHIVLPSHLKMDNNWQSFLTIVLVLQLIF